MKKILSMMFATIMVITSITFSPVKASAEALNAEDAKGVSVSKTQSFNESTEFEEAGDTILYKVTIEDAGAYIFETSGDMDTRGYLLDESQLQDYPGDNCIEFDDDDGDAYNCYIVYVLSAGDVVYFAVNEYDDSIGEFNVNIEYYDGYVEKDGIYYERDFLNAENRYIWSVVGYKNNNIKKAVILSQINGEPVTIIAEDAFYGASELSEVVIPEGILFIGYNAFANTNLENITIPESCQYISDAFGQTPLKELHITKKVGYIEKMSSCRYLEKITVAEDNTEYTSVDGVLYSKDETALIIYPVNKKDTVYQVKSGTQIICENAFAYTKNLEKAILPNTLDTIEPYAFNHSSILQVDCGSLEKIGESAFRYCTNLLYLDLPESVNQIGQGAFIGCENISVVIRNDECVIGSSIFADVTSATIYGKADSAAQIYASNYEYIEFKELDISGCEKNPQEHQNVDYYTKVPTCTEDGKKKEICVNCGQESEEIVIEKLGHDNGLCKHICLRCESIVERDTIKYATLNKTIVVEESDFEESLYVAVYGFIPEKTGEYILNLSDYSLINDVVYFIKENKAGRIVGIYYNKSTAISLEKGEALWIGVMNDNYSGKSAVGLEIGVSCNHAKTEIKTTDATCKNEGRKEEVCASCGKVMKTEILPKSAHSFKKDNPKCIICGVANPNYTPTQNEVTDVPNTIQDGNVTYTLNKDGEYVAAKAKKSAIKKLYKMKKGFKVKWKKVANVKGYQIQYSTNNKFTKKATKIKTYKGNKKFTKTIKKLKSNKKYYVRVRTYKVATIDGKSIKLYSRWSKAKRIKIK